MEPTPRRAARLLVIDPHSGAVLLCQYEDGGRSWWATPGGALDGDETFEEAAIREAAEELAKLREDRDSGTISDEEYERERERLRRY